jgi:hypothetical protein
MPDPAALRALADRLNQFRQAPDLHAVDESADALRSYALLLEAMAFLGFDVDHFIRAAEFIAISKSRQLTVAEATKEKNTG